MNSYILIAAAVALALNLFMPLLVYKLTIGGDQTSKSVLKFFAAAGLFTVCHGFLNLVLLFIFGAFAYMGVWAALGGGAASVGGLLSVAGIVELAIDVAVTVGLLAFLKHILKVQYRLPWIPLVAGILLIASEGLTILWTIEEFQPLVRSGYINREGKFAIKPIYGSAQPFCKGVARVFLPDSDYSEGKAFFIDKNGKKMDFSSADLATAIGAYRPQPPLPFIEGMAPASVKDGQRECWGYIGNDGKWIIKPIYSEALPFRDGLAMVTVWEEQPDIFGKVQKGVNAQRFIGFIDKTGKYVVPPVFSEGTSFSEGLAAVSLDLRKHRKGTPEH